MFLPEARRIWNCQHAAQKYWAILLIHSIAQFGTNQGAFLFMQRMQYALYSTHEICHGHHDRATRFKDWMTKIQCCPGPHGRLLKTTVHWYRSHEIVSACHVCFLCCEKWWQRMYFGSVQVRLIRSSVSVGSPILSLVLEHHSRLVLYPAVFSSPRCKQHRKASCLPETLYSEYPTRGRGILREPEHKMTLPADWGTKLG